MGYRTNKDKRGHLRTPFKTGYFSMFICPGFQKESNMDGWKDRTKSGRKESESGNLKTRFQDCNLSRKQESKLSRWNENIQPANQDGKLPTNQEISSSAKIESKADSRNTSKKVNNTEIYPAFLLAILNERKLSVHRYGWQAIMMYNNNSK